ncbi:hypothetical protein [Geminicoccus flavidas]|uniref:hypothetical protein n=1 Tax=Geminicoccus flavidas TaxID=2506407 RepID=UPI001359F536|nr:hypothetical protein [Geminicoccus flavidas]
MGGAADDQDEQDRDDHQVAHGVDHAELEDRQDEDGQEAEGNQPGQATTEAAANRMKVSTNSTKPASSM